MFHFLDNAINSGMCPSSEQKYKELNQDFINEQWENTTALKRDIQEQIVSENGAFEKFEFEPIEAWMNYVVGETSTGRKNGDDFVELIFKSIEHPCVKGRYYKFDENYWLAYFTNEYDSIKKSLAVRRCNNFLKMIDPENGQVFSIPCVVNYEMTAPAEQVSRYVITPNNHATVLVQGNADTTRLFKLNTRFILGGRPFKILGQQNAMYDNLLNPNPTILYLDMFLDEIHAEDDLENGIADNGEYIYNVNINANDMDVVNGDIIQLTADVTLNGVEVNKKIVWTSDSLSATIDAQGNVAINGNIGDLIIIKATLEGNPSVFSEIHLTIAEESIGEPMIILDPDFDKIRENNIVKVKLIVSYNGKEYHDILNSDISLEPNSIVTENKYLSINKIGNVYELTCKQFYKQPIVLYISASCDNPNFNVSTEKTVKLVSMFG